jgi:hypothetical protein
VRRPAHGRIEVRGRTRGSGIAARLRISDEYQTDGAAAYRFAFPASEPIGGEHMSENEKRELKKVEIRRLDKVETTTSSSIVSG